MCVIVHGVNGPDAASFYMFDFSNAIQGRITHVDIAGAHVYLGAKDVSAIIKFAFFHAFKQIKILFNAAIAIRALDSGLCQSASHLSHFFGATAVDIRLALTD